MPAAWQVSHERGLVPRERKKGLLRSIAPDVCTVCATPYSFGVAIDNAACVDSTFSARALSPCAPQPVATTNIPAVTTPFGLNMGTFLSSLHSSKNKCLENLCRRETARAGGAPGVALGS